MQSPTREEIAEHFSRFSDSLPDFGASLHANARRLPGLESLIAEALDAKGSADVGAQKCTELAYKAIELASTADDRDVGSTVREIGQRLLSFVNRYELETTPDGVEFRSRDE